MRTKRIIGNLLSAVSKGTTERRLARAPRGAGDEQRGGENYGREKRDADETAHGNLLSAGSKERDET
jgi:hypothetical protein